MAGAEEVMGGPITGEESVVAVRHALREQAVAVGLGVVAQTKLVTAGSELARNVLVHAGRGSYSVERLETVRGSGVRARFVDEGPGIPDVDEALTDGFSTVKSLGLGLSGSRRLVDEFQIETAPGRGTAVTITVWAR